MERVIGGVLGLAAGVAVAGVSLWYGTALFGSLWRAAIAVFLGYWIGRLVFGKAGLAIAKEAAGTVPAPSEEKPPESSPPSKPV